jgi:hypothetical protein
VPAEVMVEVVPTALVVALHVATPGPSLAAQISPGLCCQCRLPRWTTVYRARQSTQERFYITRCSLCKFRVAGLSNPYGSFLIREDPVDSLGVTGTHQVIHDLVRNWRARRAS